MNGKDLIRFLKSVVFPFYKAVGILVGKAVFCKVTDCEKKRRLIIDKIIEMSENELNQIIIENKGLLGKIYVNISSKEEKRRKIISQIRGMSEYELDKIIINS